MKVLLLHPEDSPFQGPWSRTRWDLIVDLGWAGSHSYCEWSKALACPVRGLYDFGEWKEDVLGIKEALRSGSGWLVDSEGIDWWDLIAPTRYQQLFELRLVQKLSRVLSAAPDIQVTRPHWLAKALGNLLHSSIACFFPEVSGRIPKRVARYIEALQTLTRAQVLEIALDKWDTDYGLRRFFGARDRKKDSSAPRVLLPSAYKNVSRVVSAYASMLPDIQFLLVTTRQGCVIEDLPPNVTSVPLASYAPLPRDSATEREILSLSERWTELESKIGRSQELGSAYACGSFKDLRLGLRNGLRIRDAWRRVLERQSFYSVLSGDENNLYTRLPILLAQKRGIPTVYCSHGALDVNVLIRGVCSETYLAKGEMEKNYLVEQCDVPAERVVIGAPASRNSPPATDSLREKSHIVFFSEAYELYSGRTENLYRELLPKLCSIARKHGRKVLIKLHPFESMSSRLQLVNEVLTGDDRNLVEVTNEPLSDRLFRRTWFSLTVESSVAVECALAGIPSFLCGWFDLGLHGYVRQYENYGAARILAGPDEIQRIPESLGANGFTADIQNRVHQSITPERLETILLGKEAPPMGEVQKRRAGSVPTHS